MTRTRASHALTCMALLGATNVGCQAYDRAVYDDLLDGASLTLDHDRADVHEANSASDVDAVGDVSDVRLESDADALDTTDATAMRSDVDDGAPGCGVNLLSNGEFEMGFLPWETLMAPPAVATLSNSPEAPHGGSQSALTNETQAGANDWDIQFYQSHLAFHSAQRMRVSFYLRGTPGHSIVFVLQHGDGSYTEYCTWHADVTSNWTEVVAECMTPDDVEGRIGFQLGHSAGQTFIDSVSLVACGTLAFTDAGDVTITDAPDARTDTSADAAFDAGTDAWSAHDAGSDASFDARGDITIDAAFDAHTDSAADVVREAGGVSDATHSG